MLVALRTVRRTAVHEACPSWILRALVISVGCLTTWMPLPSLLAQSRDVRLLEAVKRRDQRAFTALLKARADVNGALPDGSTALAWAVHLGQRPMAEALLDSGANANTADEYGETPVTLAAANGDADLVKRLLAAGGDARAARWNGETALMIAAGAGSLDAVRQLAQAGADVNIAEPRGGQTALMWAAAEHHADVVRTLIEARADLQARTRKGFTTLHFAAREGDLEVTRLLLRAGVDMDIRSQPEAVETGRGEPERSAGRSLAGGSLGRGPAYQATLSAGSTPLLVATVRGHVPLALFLLEQGADPNVIDAGFAPLHWASGTWEGGVSNPVYGFADPMSGIPNRQAKLQLVKALLAHGANPNGRMTRRPPNFAGLGGGYEDAPGATPFLLASAATDLEMMKLLVAAGADPAPVTDTKATPVMAASGLNRGIGESPITEEQALETVRFLLELGADAKGATTNGENALFGAAYRGWNTLLGLLIEKGADVNAVSKAGVTP